MVERSDSFLLVTVARSLLYNAGFFKQLEIPCFLRYFSAVLFWAADVRIWRSKNSCSSVFCFIALWGGGGFLSPRLDFLLWISSLIYWESSQRLAQTSRISWVLRLKLCVALSSQLLFFIIMQVSKSEKVVLASQQPGLIDTSTKRLISKTTQQYQGPTTFAQPVVTRRIHRKLVPMDDHEETVQQPVVAQPQPIVHPVQQMIWPVAVQFNEDDALSKIREEKMLALLERQSEMLMSLLSKYKRLEEDQTNKIQRRIKELERENEEIWQRRRQNYLIYNVAQAVDSKLKEFNEFQMKPFLDQGQPVLLKPLHRDDRLFFDKRPKQKKARRKVEVDDGLFQDPETGELWDPRTNQVVSKSQIQRLQQESREQALQLSHLD